ncbi:MAG: carbohydrate kinase family protein [Phenylobacterium sp.]|uniref:carbohydrate kinase family protein n=1 Tax=Phenylobacterium sp. TaxID=1871053 RepID=UPI0011FF91D7|nr:PfkB family carbohydrate kinase [Phenylobacterium sp.]TAJ72438.1 MAG: carbohydrate kinase family protein [Phenylobacterium sp.]
MKTGLLTIGLTTLDIVASPIDALPKGEGTTLIRGIACAPAGTAGGAAMVAARLGVPVKLASALGSDLTGRFVRMALEEAGVDTSLLPVLDGMPTSTTVLAVDSQGRRPNFHALGAGMLAMAGEDVVAAAKLTRFLHYGGVGGPKLDGGPGAGLLRAAHEAGAVVTCDLISPQASALEELKRLLPFVDYFMPSAAEALALTGSEDLDAAADAFLALGAKACIIKNGGKGSYAVLPEGRYRLPAHVITPVDTTSCGDSYCAGFIAALSRGRATLDACRFATATAALVAQGLATLGKLDSFEATEAAMRAMPLAEAA